MTENKLKEILSIKEWCEINEPVKFLKLMNYYYQLAPGIRAKILPKISDINGLVERFKKYCADGIIEYEPSIFLIISKLVDDLQAAVGNTNKIRGTERRDKISYMYNAFSEWFGFHGQVKCSIGENNFVCSIAEAIEIAYENEVSDEKCELKMMLLNKERVDLIEFQNAISLENMDLDIDFLAELLANELGVGVDFEISKKYLM